MSRHLEEPTIAGFEDLGPVARSEAVAHAADCAACRVRLLEADPTRAFALLADLEVPEARLARFDAELARELSALSSRATGPRWLRLASVAASIALAALILGLVGDRATDRSARPGVASSIGVAPYGTVELLSSPGEAQVLDLRVGGTQVVMIFDEDLEL